MNNPSLRTQPRTQHAPIIQSNSDASILSWLEGTGRLMDRDVPIDPNLLEDDMDELSGVLAGSDDYEADDSDDGDDDL
jgi:hypothetical protein